MADQFLGEIRLVPFNFAPQGWAFCSGQLLPISQNTALFSLLGITYGGDGRANFALPDLRGRVAMESGQGAGLSPYDLGQEGGSENVGLSLAQIPAHTHALNATTDAATTRGPGGSLLAQATRPVYETALPANTSLAAGAVGFTGGGQPHNNLQPYLVLTYIIALTGIYPSRP